MAKADYRLEEVVSEKWAVLMGRDIPWDLYDFEYLANNEEIELQDIFYEYQSKHEHNGHNPDEFIKKLTAKKNVFEKAWKKTSVIKSCSPLC